MRKAAWPKAVIFDMDGVLIDARDWHYRALNDALEIFGATISMQEHVASFDGLPTKEKLRLLTSEGRLPSHLHHLVERVKQERTLREAASLCFPRIEHLLMMSWLHRSGCKVGVATNSIRHSSTTMLGFAGLLEQIDVIVTNEDVVHAKPAPDIYAEACHLLSVDARDTLVIEDNEYGVQAAKAAGCSVIKVKGVAEVNTTLIAPHMTYENG